jgi:hypothetical protein
MPTNRFACPCGEEWDYVGPRKDRPCPACGTMVKPMLPVDVEAPSVMETVDKALATRWRDDFKARAKKRNKFYNDKTALERARDNGEDPKRHGLDEDSPKMI